MTDFGNYDGDNTLVIDDAYRTRIKMSADDRKPEEPGNTGLLQFSDDDELTPAEQEIADNLLSPKFWVE
ncbi:hypothetical protein [uncultured Sneathiella sp.]|uniref:hypothetical protein n=1 Tax=uncultured Sneathiella sp. TaxID=879315 RepID=UPI0030EF9EEA|tara:strand:- start:12245 stop:12451 length:207 start_codon:yes stop_codon:yes gene_type:complete